MCSDFERLQDWDYGVLVVVVVCGVGVELRKIRKQLLFYYVANENRELLLKLFFRRNYYI